MRFTLSLLARTLSTGTNCNAAHQEVRVRFAPSPTGHIHLGGLRAALYNYIFARQNDGKFILRIEDTDRTRVVPGSAEEIENVLNWAGLKPDESPSLGGPYAPYVQSKRTKIYIDRAHELLEQGKAYKCFCSPDRLELLRIFQARNREKPHYDGKCRHLSPAEQKEKMEENNGKFVIRFALTSGDIIFEDLVFGHIKNNLVDSKESDFIILKGDQNPTYHFSNVVDDNHMHITSIIRGAEWLSSTAKHIQVYRAFGWPEPQFIHFPLINMEDGVKMSKRNNHSHVTKWIQAGYKPQALFNFLTNTGGGVPKEKQDSMKLWSLDDFIKGFDFKQITVHPASLDSNRLKIYSSKLLLETWSKNPDSLMTELDQIRKENQIEADIDYEHSKKVVANLINRITTLKDLLAPDYAFIWKHPNLSWSKQEYLEKGWDLRKIIEETISATRLNDIENKDEFIGALKAVSEKHLIRYSDYMRFLRRILTSADEGLPIHEIAQCLGKFRLLSYLERNLRYVT